MLRSALLYNGTIVALPTSSCTRGTLAILQLGEVTKWIYPPCDVSFVSTVRCLLWHHSNAALRRIVDSI